MPSSSARGELLEAIGRELAAGRAFATLLEDERIELQRTQPERLPEFAKLKAAAASELGRCSDARRAALARAGFPPGRNGLEQACSSADARRSLDDMLACARRIRALREHNETLLNLRLQQVGSALSVLLQRGPDTPAVYGADGRAQSGAHGGPRRGPRATA